MEELGKRKSKPRPPPLDPSGPRRPGAAKANLGESERRNDLKHRLQTALHELEFRKRLEQLSLSKRLCAGRGRRLCLG